MHSDNAPAIHPATKTLGVIWDPAEPGEPRTDAIAERAVYDVFDGTRSLLVRAGFPGYMWTQVMPTYCLLENTAKRDDGTSPWTDRFDSEFRGLRLAPGMLLWYRPARTIYDLDTSQPRLQAGVFLGYRLNGGHKWNGEYLVIDLDDFVGKDLGQRASPSGVRFSIHITKTVRVPGVLAPNGDFR